MAKPWLGIPIHDELETYPTEVRPPTEAHPMSSPRTSVASVYTATPVAFIPGENQGKTRSKLPSGKRSHIIYGKSPCYEWVNENELSMAIENIANCSFTRGYISTSIDLCWNWFLLGFSTLITNQFLSWFFFNWGSINGMAQTPTRSCYWLYLLKLYPTYWKRMVFAFRNASLQYRK